MSFPIKISWDCWVRGGYFLCLGRWGSPVSFYVLHLLVSLLHTEGVQDHASVCKLEIKPNLQTSVLGKNTLRLWLPSWFCFVSACCQFFPIAAKPLAHWAALYMWDKISMKKPCLGITKIHVKYEWKFIIFWYVGDAWEMPSLPGLLD